MQGDAAAGPRPMDEDGDSDATGKQHAAGNAVVSHMTGADGLADVLDEQLLDPQSLLLCERSVELMVDLLSQLPTRRFGRTLLLDRAILVKCRMSALFGHPHGALP